MLNDKPMTSNHVAITALSNPLVNERGEVARGRNPLLPVLPAEFEP